jgi:hypothetical protein
MLKKQLKIFLITTLILFGLGALGLIIANALASEPEKSIESDRQQFLSQFPDSPTNESAKELEKLALPLGLDLVKMPDEEEAAIAETQKQAFEEIKEELDKYLDGAVAQTSERIEAPPEKLQRYLETNAATLEALSDYALKEEAPQWETDITWIATGDLSTPLPNWIGLLNLEKILLLDALQKSREGRNEEAIARFAASWKIRQSLDGRPELIAQLVNAVVLRLQGGTLRQFEEVPPEWQQRLVERDVIREMITAIEGEFLFVYEATRDVTDWELEGEEALFLNSPIGRTYVRWSAIDTYHSSNSLPPLLETSNVCSFDEEAIAPSLRQVAWWNILGQIAQPSFSSQWERAGRIMLELELTEKVLQVKEMAAKEGKLPESLPNAESAVCPGYQWVYEVSGDKSSLSLTPTPTLGEDSKALPLIYYP